MTNCNITKKNKFKIYKHLIQTMLPSHYKFMNKTVQGKR